LSKRNKNHKPIRRKKMAMKSLQQPDVIQQPLLNDESFLRNLVSMVCQQLLEAEISATLQALPYERTESREGYRNGYKPRQLKTRVGKLSLEVPQDREGIYQTQLFERYQRSEKAFIATLQEMYIQGVSTRKVKEITQALCGIPFSKSTVCQLTSELDSQIKAFLERPLEAEYPYLFIDAKYEKVRENHKIVSKGVLIVLGVNSSGQREILDVSIASGENETTYSDLFKRLQARGLNPRGVKLVISDDHLGLRKALDRYFQGVSWQRCQVHFLRNMLNRLPHKERKAFASKLKDVFAAPEFEVAVERLKALVLEYKEKYPAVAETLEEEAEFTLTCFQFPEEHRKRIRTTNCLERFNEEVDRRSRVIRIFPNDASALRIVVSLAIEQNEEWIAAKSYLDMSLLDLDLDLNAPVKSEDDSDTKVTHLGQKEVNLTSSVLTVR
jgi:transposase-like protein